MGNYCCDKLPTKRKVNKKLGIDFNSTKRIRSSHVVKDYEEYKEEFLQILKSQEFVNSSFDCPSITNIEVIGDLGKGGQAEVYQAILETALFDSEIQVQPVALKRIIKPKNSHRASQLSMGSQLLIQNQCPFLIQGLMWCENQSKMYELMKIAEGGDLSTFMQTTIGKGDSFKKLGEEGIRMVLAGIVLGLQYLHTKCFIYCDLKIENVLIGKDGYPRLADFNLASLEPNIEVDSFQGTLTSVGPEIFTQKYVNRGIDLWAFGVLIFTLLYGIPPYCFQDIQDGSFVQQCKKKQNRYGLKRKKVSPQILSLINGLLKCKPEERIGFTQIKQIKQHAFFRGFDWEKYEKKQLQSPLAGIVAQYNKKSEAKLKRSQTNCSPVSQKNGRRTGCDL